MEEALLKNRNKILIPIEEGIPDRFQAISSTIRPRSCWEYDVETNRRKLHMRGKISLDNIEFDSDENATLTFGYDVNTDEYAYHWRSKDTTAKREMYRLHEDRF